LGHIANRLTAVYNIQDYASLIFLGHIVLVDYTAQAISHVNYKFNMFFVTH